MKIKVRYKLPPTTTRVAQHTQPEVNQELRRQTFRSLNSHRKSPENAISARIKKLNSEWDTERVLETNAAIMVLLGSLLGWKHSRKWFLLSGTAGAFLLQHALQGWCPTVPLIRKMGIRTADEISTEKTALKVLRGDFALNNFTVPGALAAAERQ